MNKDDKEWFAEEENRQDTPPVKDDGSEDNRLELAKGEEPDINLEAEHNKN